MIRKMCAGSLVFVVAFAASQASADEFGVSFWLPGLYGSFAAVPGKPGWSFASIYTTPPSARVRARLFHAAGPGKSMSA